MGFVSFVGRVLFVAAFLLSAYQEQFAAAAPGILHGCIGARALATSPGTSAEAKRAASLQEPPPPFGQASTIQARRAVARIWSWRVAE
ncbi:hypothetical protein C2845_PM02G37390 [Panicum miliaceum]|uniref:Secreted protein n=1 Tax=Panicum miliaceum TaxID=4540 RepID=A0A3L6SE75_PANMI|nr:hypothetical protein C2845_PM02G37390 [Panicum miliaceum]